MTNIEKLFPDKRHDGDTDLRKAQLVMLRIMKIVDYICTEHNITYWLDAGTLLGAVRHGGFVPWDDDLDIVMPREDFEKFLTIAGDTLPADLFLQTPATAPDYSFYGRPPCKIRDKYSSIVENNVKYESVHKGIFIDVFALDKFTTSSPGKYVDYFLKWCYKYLCGFHNLSRTNGKGLKTYLRNIAARLSQKVDTSFLLDRFSVIVKRKIERSKLLCKDYKIGCGYDIPWIRSYDIEEIYPLKRIQFEDAYFLVPNNCDSILKKFFGEYMKLPDEDKRYRHIAELNVDTRIAG